MLHLSRVTSGNRASSNGRGATITTSDSPTNVTTFDAMVNHMRRPWYTSKASSTNSPAVSQHSDHGPPVRKRTSKPKVRTGCVNCKQRHLKCDERKPYCSRCEDYGILCQGYAATKVARRDRCPQKPPQRTILPRPGLFLSTSTPVHGIEEEQSNAVVTTALSLHRSPELIPSLNHQDGHYLDFFSREVVHHLSPHYPSRFWSNISLCEIPSNECILHAVLGIGACSRAIEEAARETCAQKGTDAPSTAILNARQSLWLHARGNRHHRAALAHYSKAIQTLRSKLRMHMDARTAMMATLLFIAFENMQGNYHVAGSLIRSGLKVLAHSLTGAATTERRLSFRGDNHPPFKLSTPDITSSTSSSSRSSSYSSPFSPSPRRVPAIPASFQLHSGYQDGEIAEMAQMYARHSITRLFMPFPHCRSAYHMLTETRGSMGKNSRLRVGMGFATMQEAQSVWDFYLPSLATFIQKCTWHNFNAAYEFDSRAARREQSDHEASLISFGAAFGHLQSTLCTNRREKANQFDGKQPWCTSGMVLLALQHAAVTIFTKCCLDPSDLMYDAHVEQFRDILSKCHDLAPGMVGQRRSPGGTAHLEDHNGHHVRQPLFFLNDAAILPILGFIACRCRDWVVRQEALCLIERFDWREGGWDSLLLSKGIRALLELEKTGGKSGGSVSSSARYAWTNVSNDSINGNLSLEFTRLLPEADGEYAKTEVKIHYI